MPTYISHMELLIRGCRIYFPLLIHAFKPYEELYKSLNFEYPKSKSDPTGYRLYPKRILQHNQQTKTKNDATDNLNESSFDKLPSQRYQQLRKKQLQFLPTFCGAPGHASLVRQDIDLFKLRVFNFLLRNYKMGCLTFYVFSSREYSFIKK